MLICFVFLFSAPRPLFAESPPLLLEVNSALTSYYGTKFEGKKTANGQRYNSEALTAAHRSLPFGTVVRVTNLANGRDAIVRINDRGPVSKHRLLDLSRAAARELNMIRAGVTKIHMEQIGDARGRPVIPGTDFYLDMGTVRSEAGAKADMESLNGKISLPAGTSLRLVKEAMPKNKVRQFIGIGPFSTFNKAEKAFIELKKKWPRTRVVCAKTRDLPTGATLALAVPADNLPDSVANYKGKASEVKAPKSSKKSRATTPRKSSRTSRDAASTAEKTSSKKATATKASTRAATAEKTSSKKATATKASARAATAEKTSSKKATATKASTRAATAEKTSSQKATVTKASARAATAEKTSSKKATATKASTRAATAEKTSAKKATATKKESRSVASQKASHRAVAEN